MNSIPSHWLDVFARMHGVELARSLGESRPSSFRGRVPDEWIAAASAEPGSIGALWQRALPWASRFVDYLTKTAEHVAILDAYGAACLVFALPDWDEQGLDRFPGFCWMGSPTTLEAMDRFAAEVGALPETLRALWSVAGFVTFKDHSVLCSLEVTQQQIADPPRVLAPLSFAGRPEKMDCLQISVVNGQIVNCLTRAQGTRVWDDFIVQYFQATAELAPAVRTTVFDKLTDWTFSEYE